MIRVGLILSQLLPILKSAFTTPHVSAQVVVVRLRTTGRDAVDPSVVCKQNTITAEAVAPTEPNSPQALM